MATKRAKSAGANEALIVDGEGRVIEGATSNLFFVRSGVLWTPGEQVGILAGITRAVVIEAARDLHIPLVFGCVTAQELAGVDELFITSSIRQMLSVVAVDAMPIGNGRPGPIYRRLFERFRQIVAR
jgi:branched-chain amino acid aminotransferase